MRRRTFLAAAGGVLVSGCISNASSGTGSEREDGGGSVIKARLKSLAGQVSSGPIRCDGDPTSVSETMQYPTRDNDLEYIPSNETFRVGVAESANRTWFENVPFEQWIEIESAERGAKRVREVTVDRLGTGEFYASSASFPNKSDSLVVLLTVTDNDQGNETAGSEPVALWRLVRVAPRSVEATVSIDGDSYTRTVAVFAEPMSDAVPA